MTDYKAGDEVQIRTTGYTERGVIEKVGRTLVHIRWRHRLETFRVADQRRTGPQIGTGCYFRTIDPEREAREEREFEARSLLRRHGIDLSLRRSFTLEQVEALAEVVKDWDR